MLLQDLYKKNLIHPPRWLIQNTAYITIMGSQAYGVSGESSDLDIYGFCIPPKEIVFPHLGGIIIGFGHQSEKFDQWQEHKIINPDKQTEYDFTIFNIIRYFQLCMENNPNGLDSLFTPRRCVIHSTKISEHLRENRRLFLHKGSYPNFRGYAASQLGKIKGKVNSSNPKRAADIEKNGIDTKFAYHVVRLAFEAEQILSTHDLDLERDKEVLKSIRRGEWQLEKIIDWFTEKEKTLESLYVQSTLRAAPDENLIKKILIECLEMHYGNLDTAISRVPELDHVLNDIQQVLDRYKLK